jgi:hypothetical protein
MRASISFNIILRNEGFPGIGRAIPLPALSKPYYYITNCHLFGEGFYVRGAGAPLSRLLPTIASIYSKLSSLSPCTERGRIGREVNIVFIFSSSLEGQELPQLTLKLYCKILDLIFTH